MNPILIAAVLAAWLVSACRSKDEEAPTKTELSVIPSPTGPIPISPEPLAPAEAPIKVDFGGDLEAVSLYHRLLEGNPPSENLNLVMDQGCAYEPREQSGQRDRWIEPCELRRFLLESHQKHPELARETVGAPVPWSLDDGDNRTDFDDDIRGAIDSAVAQIRSSDSLKGKDPFELKYQEVLAKGVFHFAYFPTKATLFGEDEATDTLQGPLEDLTKIGLEGFRDYLLENGGLGLAEFPENSSKSLSALEALKQKEGDVYSMANVVYGVLEAAGLPVDFYRLLNGEDAKLPNAISDQSGILERPPEGMGVSLPLMGSLLVFNPQNGEHHVSPSMSLMLSSDRYLAQLLNDQADRLNWAGKPEQAVEAYRRSLNWVGGQSEAYNNLGVALHQSGKKQEAEVSFRESLRLNPGSNLAYFNLAWLLEKKGRGEEALALAEKGSAVLGAKKGYVALGLRVAQEALKRNPDDAKAIKLQSAMLKP
ncbi:MAG TPA: tetratricopeptide repeat protein [bacterium]|nr:tetratricopeptide repeat protein [bacterium]